MLRADEISGFLCIFEVDGIQVHADGERADLLAEELGRDRADEAGIEAAGEQEAERRVRVSTAEISFSRIFFVTVSRSSLEYLVTVVRSV